MAEIKMFKAYEGAGKIVKPEIPVEPNIVTVRDG